MEITTRHKTELNENGFTKIEGIYNHQEIAAIIEKITQADRSKDTFRKSAELFAIRQVLKEVPGLPALIFNERLKECIHDLFGPDYFVVKSIYFDKPERSNWYVAYHQDLTIAVDKKMELENFGPWKVRQNQFSVQPPVAILESIFTIRIHLEETDADNGALKVIEKSHLKQIYRPEDLDRTLEKETTCPVKEGGIMIMKPLLLHSSGKTTSHKRRRVIHIEFSDQELPAGLSWVEKLVW